MLTSLVGDISGVRGRVPPVLRRKGNWSVGTGGGAGGAYWRGGIAFISAPSCRWKVPDMGVRMGDEMLTPFMFFFRGDLRMERMDDVRDCFFSSSPRFRFAGLFFPFFRMPCDVWDAGDAGVVVCDWGDGSGGPSYSLPSSLAA
jgi:hypothetical protein